MVDEEVALIAVVLDVPLEDGAVSGLEHDVLLTQAVDDGRRGTGVPLDDILGDALGLDHDDRGTGVECALTAVDEVADVLGLLEVLVDGVVPVAQDGLDPAAGGDVAVIFVGDVAEGADPLRRHQGEGATGPLDAVDPVAGDVEDVLQVTGAVGVVVGCANLGHAEGAGLGGPLRAGGVHACQCRSQIAGAVVLQAVDDVADLVA